MSTTYINLGSTPIQITTGTNFGFVQSLSAQGFKWAESSTSPNTALKSHSSKELSISPPFKIWIWNNLPYTIPVAYSVAT